MLYIMHGLIFKSIPFVLNFIPNFAQKMLYIMYAYLIVEKIRQIAKDSY